jgi:hypothetical protein
LGHALGARIIGTWSYSWFTNIFLINLIVHYKTLKLMSKFLAHKKDKGSSIEKQIYQDMGLEDFIIRLVKKRPLTFFDVADSTLMR